MSAHQPFPPSDGREGSPVAAAGRAGETPTMNELLAAGAAASAVSTPPDAAEEARQDKPAEPAAEESEEPASTGGRDAA